MGAILASKVLRCKLGGTVRQMVESEVPQSRVSQRLTRILGTLCRGPLYWHEPDLRFLLISPEIS